jgi:hypothetical protein
MPESPTCPLLEQLEAAERRYIDAGDGDRASVMHHSRHLIAQLRADLANAEDARIRAEAEIEGYRQACIEARADLANVAPVVLATMRAPLCCERGAYGSRCSACRAVAEARTALPVDTLNRLREAHDA